MSAKKAAEHTSGSEVVLQSRISTLGAQELGNLKKKKKKGQRKRKKKKDGMIANVGQGQSDRDNFKVKVRKTQQTKAGNETTLQVDGSDCLHSSLTW